MDNQEGWMCHTGAYSELKCKACLYSFGCLFYKEMKCSLGVSKLVNQSVVKIRSCTTCFNRKRLAICVEREKNMEKLLIFTS